MKDPLIVLIENDPMFRRMFLDYDKKIPILSKLIHRIRLLFKI